MAKKRLTAGLGSITDLGGNRKKPFRATVPDGQDENGKTIRKTLGYYATYDEAYEALIQFRHTPVDLDLKDVTIADAFEFWSKSHFHKVGKHSISKYNSTFNKHLEPFHKTKMKDIKLDHILTMITDKTQPVQFDIILLMKMLSTWAMKRDIIYKNYAELVKVGDAPIKPAARRKSSVFTTEEIERLWEDVDIEYNDVVLILLYTGLRIDELLLMESKDVHLDENYMIGGLKKYTKEKELIKRVIPIHPLIKPLIEKRLADGHEYLIVNYNTGDRMLYGTFVKSHWNEDHTRHDTRHTFITKMKECGADFVWTKKIVGHALGTVSERYMHVSPEVLYNEVCKLQYVKKS